MLYVVSAAHISFEERLVADNRQTPGHTLAAYPHAIRASGDGTGAGAWGSQASSALSRSRQGEAAATAAHAICLGCTGCRRRLGQQQHPCCHRQWVPSTSFDCWHFLHLWTSFSCSRSRCAAAGHPLRCLITTSVLSPYLTISCMCAGTPLGDPKVFSKQDYLQELAADELD